MESFAGADLHKRVTQLAVLRDGQPPSQFRFLNDPNTVQAVLRKLPRGTKIAVEATGSWWNLNVPLCVNRMQVNLKTQFQKNMKRTRRVKKARWR